MIESIVIITLSILTLIGITGSVVYYIKFSNMIKVIAQLLVDKEVLLDKIDAIILETSNEANEGFIKFLSESRAAAFDYIENVQKAISQYLVAIENGNPDEVVTARMELFSHLPEIPESENKNKG
jgi:ribonucleotide reductase alpha subunit